MIKLGDICKIKRGQTITKKDALKGSIPVVAGGILPAYYHNKLNREPPIITVSGSGVNAGFVNFFNQSIWASDCSTIQSLDETKIRSLFIYYCLKFNQNKIYNLKRGAAIPHVYPSDLATFKIPVSPIDTQEKIISEIDSYQKIIDGAQQIIDNWKPVIDISPDWPLVQLGDDKYFQILPSGVEPFKGTKAYLSTNSIDSDKIIDVEKYITYEDRPARANMTPLINSVWFAKMLNTQKVYIFDNTSNAKRYILSTGFSGITVNDRLVLPLFLKYVLQGDDFNKQKNRLCFGVTQSAINNKSIQSIAIPLPEIKVQKAIIENIQKDERIVASCKILIESTDLKIKQCIRGIY